MTDAKTLLLAALVAVTLAFLATWFVIARRRRASGADGATEPVLPTTGQLAIGFFSNFFDTLGIGSFATTTAAFRFWKMVPDELIPGSLNVGHAVNPAVQSMVFISVVQVEFVTLVAMIGAACLGAWLGAGVVAGLSRRAVQAGMGSALLGASLVVMAQLLDIVPAGNAMALTGTRLAIGIAGNFVLGALMSLGVGLYAPCMVLVSLLGMDPKAAFPIMMGSCAFLMPFASLKFLQRGAYHLRASLALTLGGPIAVLLAVWLFRELPTPVVRVLVLAVILSTAVSMLRAARQRQAATA